MPTKAECKKKNVQCASKMTGVKYRRVGPEDVSPPTDPGAVTGVSAKSAAYRLGEKAAVLQLGGSSVPYLAPSIAAALVGKTGAGLGALAGSLYGLTGIKKEDDIKSILKRLARRTLIGTGIGFGAGAGLGLGAYGILRHAAKKMPQYGGIPGAVPLAKK
jgi:hypothetical protein